jgi:glucose-1-phosphate thymidylyltransferase
VKALVLAGGEGRRLRPLTYSGPKQLVPVANRPILAYVLDRVVEAGIRDIGVVVAPETRGDIEAAVREIAAGASVTFIPQDRPGGLAHAVLVARRFLGDEPFLMVLGDNVIGTSLAASALRFEREPQLAAWLLLKEVDDPRRFGVAVVDGERVVGLVEKPADPPSRLALVGVYLLRPSIHDAIAAIRPSARGELEITDAISELMRRGGDVRFDRLEAFWLDTGKKDDLLLANETVLRAWLAPEVRGEVDAATRLEGAVRVELGARVVRSTVHGPSIIGPGAIVEDATVGPCASIGAGAAIVRSRVSSSVVMDHARVEDAGHIDRSILGKRVVVRRAPTKAAASFIVGDDCEIVRGEREA